ncbi:trypsin-like serine protease [Filobacillus milosensis]|uniref:Trypsin-like serine protease n=1 Tax=Filobacillus milosensis TaxID=94137 RepID=A0A4Y8ITG2_9BACI|nr:trypsin-like peptidase domain-containing protein [Filobacillus milosensis]TFB24077.1 trypsin-like serine protease [Filobacillus milosensis]
MTHRKGRTLPISLSIIILVSTVIVFYSYYSHWEDEVLASSKGMIEVVEEQEGHKTRDWKTIIHQAQKDVVQLEAIGPIEHNYGSGFVYNQQGDVVTNAHIVENADDIFIKTSDTSTYPGALIGIDETLDVALIRVPQLANQGTLDIDPSFEPHIGDNIIAVGSPHGQHNTFTDGIISAKNRSFTLENYEYKNLYQVSANISQGNSGGPLIHRDSGLIIGINSAATIEGNSGFTIPISQVYERIQMWSDKADDEELNYDGDLNHQQSLDPQSLQKKAKYLINYYYESLNVRDYLSAYSLLGSHEQIKRTYQEFRELNVRSINIDIVNQMEVEIIDNDLVVLVVSADHYIRKDAETMEVYRFKTNYEVGFENDQLKILSLERQLISKTEQKVKENKNEES